MSRSSQGRLRSVIPWFLVFGTIAAILLLSLRVLEPPVLPQRHAPVELFSEARAGEIVYQLTERIGRRVNGTEGYMKAAEYLATRAARDPGRRGRTLPRLGYLCAQALSRVADRVSEHQRPGSSTGQEPRHHSSRRSLRHAD